VAVALDGAQLVARDRMFDGEAALEASDPNPGSLDIKLGAPHLDGLAYPQAVPIDHEQKYVKSGASIFVADVVRLRLTT
jgi:hypothetical protein